MYKQQLLKQTTSCDRVYKLVTYVENKNYVWCIIYILLQKLLQPIWAENKKTSKLQCNSTMMNIILSAIKS